MTVRLRVIGDQPASPAGAAYFAVPRQARLQTLWTATWQGPGLAPTDPDTDHRLDFDPDVAGLATGERDTRSDLGRLLAEQGRLEEAVDVYRSAIGTDGVAPWPLGELLEKLGRAEEAIDVYERAVAAGQGHLRKRLARALTRQGRIDDAVTVVRDAIRESDLYAYKALGYLLARQDREAELLAEAQQLKDAGELAKLLFLATGANTDGW